MARASAVLIALLLGVPAWASGGGGEGEAPAVASSDEHGSSDLVEHSARTSSRDVKVPTALVSRVEKDYDKFLTNLGVINKTPYRRVLLNLRAEFRQKRTAALHENARVLTPLGGGVVDLVDLVTPVRGAFTLKIAAVREDGHIPENLHVFYVSGAKNRILDREEYGAGCNKWMDITTYFNKVMGREGFQLYTADQRYLSVIGGTFVVVGFSREAIEVGTIAFTDSRYPQVMCE